MPPRPRPPRGYMMFPTGHSRSLASPSSTMRSWTRASLQSGPSSMPAGEHCSHTRRKAQGHRKHCSRPRSRGLQAPDLKGRRPGGNDVCCLIVARASFDGLMSDVIGSAAPHSTSGYLEHFDLVKQKKRWRVPSPSSSLSWRSACARGRRKSPSTGISRESARYHLVLVIADHQQRRRVARGSPLRSRRLDLGAAGLPPRLREDPIGRRCATWFDQSTKSNRATSPVSTTYSTYEAKARVSELMRKVRAGQRVIISYRGKASRIRPLDKETR